MVMTANDQKKTPSFGIGKRNSQQVLKGADLNIPGPTSYSIKSQFDLNRISQHNLKNGKGFSFTSSRNDNEKVYNAAKTKLGGGPDAGLYNLKSFVEMM